MFLFPAIIIANNINQPFVDLSIGRVYGISKQYTNEYLGIQYGNITKRWTKPDSLSNITFPNKIYNATQFGPCCIQLNSTYSDLYINEPLTENCLFLNIFTPKPKAKSIPTTTNAQSSQLLPVLFWIYGGGGNFGCSSQALPHIYNGTNIISHLNDISSSSQVIVVTINYRLDVLSKLYLPELINENYQDWPTSGNYGLLDMICALHWINNHISEFGGNPNNITVFGQSAGGNSGIDLAAMTISKLKYDSNSNNNDIKDPDGNQYLFNSVISESGDAFVNAGYSNQSTAIMKSYHFCDLIGCNRTLFDNTTEGDQLFLKCLRNADATQMFLINNVINFFIIVL